MIDDWLNPIVGIYDDAVMEAYGADKPRLGVAGRLKEAFPECKIYTTDDVKQGIEEPCFFIADVDYADEKVVGNRYQMFYTIDIHFFPSPNTGNKYSDIRRMRTAISDAIEYIKVLDPNTMDAFQMTGTGRRSDDVDGVLHTFVSYNTFFMKPAPALPIMESFTQNGSLKP